MSTVMHSPSPWAVERRGNSRWISPADRNAPLVCMLIARERDTAGPGKPPMFTREDEANARLIAAAPDLLEALEAVMREIGRRDDRGPRTLPETVWNKAQAALAKARGEP